MHEKLIYREPRTLTHLEVVEELKSNEPDRVADALMSAARHDEDCLWLQNECLRLLKSPDVTVRQAAATCLGDMAFFFHRPVHHVKVMEALYEVAHNSSEEAHVADAAKFSISLIKQRFSAQ